MKSTKNAKNKGFFKVEKGAMSLSRNTAIAIGVCALVVLLVLILFVSYQKSKTVGQKSPYEQGYVEGFRDARSLTNVSGAREKASTASLEGRVNSISQGVIHFTVTNLVLNEEVDGIGLSRIARVDDKAKIIVISQKLDADFRKEQDAYFEKYGASNNEVAPPTPFSEVEGTIKDIQVGDFVSIEGVSASDIAYASDIDAGIVKVMRISGAQE